MVEELADEADDRGRRRLQQHPPRRAPGRADGATGAHALLSVTGDYNRPNRRGIIRHYEEVAPAAGGTPVIVYNIPSRTTLNLDPEPLAELAQIDGIEAVKQSNSLRAPADRRPDGDDRQRRGPRALPRLGCAGGIRVSSHIVGTEMRRMFDEPARRAEIDAPLRDVLRAMFCTASPIPVKAALNLLGHDVGGLRLPLVEADDPSWRSSAAPSNGRDC